MALLSSVKVPRLCLIADQTWKNPPSHQKNKHIVDESEMPFCFFFFLKKIWLEVKYIICFLSPFFLLFSSPKKSSWRNLKLKASPIQIFKWHIWPLNTQEICYHITWKGRCGQEAKIVVLINWIYSLRLTFTIVAACSSLPLAVKEAIHLY